jgi:N-acetylmuramoyl-L-alanine amidase
MTVSSAVAAEKSDIASQYYKAENKYRDLLENTKDRNRRDKWIECITLFREVYEEDKTGIWAPAGLYQAGAISRTLYKFSGKKTDLDAAVDYLNMASTFKKSRYSLRAEKILSGIKPDITGQAVQAIPQIKSSEEKKAGPAPVAVSASGLASVKQVRFGSLPARTRIVVDTDEAVKYRYGLLKRDPGISKYKRLYLDIRNSTVADGISSKLRIDDERVADARVARYSLDSVRVVVDIKNYNNYKIFSLREPNRIVVDIWGRQLSPADDEEHEPVNQNAGGGNPSIDGLIGTGDFTRQFALGVKTIVIDPGHGGMDRGAPGYKKGVYEKDIVLAIGKQLAEKIKTEIKCNVVLTRSTDKFLTLEERTNIANKNRADLFISIHTNASRSHKAYGIETYFLNLAKDRDAVSVAARENATSEKNISDLQTILDSLMRNTKINESSKLAKYVQGSIYSELRKKYSLIKNKGVKQAPFYVLIGARMPSILVETSFISNKRECSRLLKSDYQDKICDSIVSGIKDYIKEAEVASLY